MSATATGTAYDPARVITDLRALAARTGGPDGSRRLAWTPEWLEARALLRESLATLPVEVDTDEAGQPVGGAPRRATGDARRRFAPRQRAEGRLARRRARRDVRARAAPRRSPPTGTPPVTVALVDWADEEGARFSRSLFGSAACMGTLDIDVLRELTDKEGGKLPEVLAAHGVDIENLDGARTRMADVKAYVEVHIEQGPILESKGLGICTVTGTKGIERERLVFRGQAAHAGTMPMEMRRDSFRAAARFALAIAEIGERHEGVTTVGHAQCWPGVVTAVAGETRITMDMRHISADSLQAMFDEAHDGGRCRGGGGGVHGRVGAHLPHPADAVPPEAARRGARRPSREVEGHDVEIPSGALHDASEMAREVPTVMIFSSSIAGLSHTKEEDTPEEHLRLAADAFHRTCRRAIELVAAGEL